MNIEEKVNSSCFNFSLLLFYSLFFTRMQTVVTRGEYIIEIFEGEFYRQDECCLTSFGVVLLIFLILRSHRFLMKGLCAVRRNSTKNDHCYYCSLKSSLRECLVWVYMDVSDADAFKYKFFARGVRLWNIIPYHLTTKPSIESFRTATFQWISPLQWYRHPGTNTWCLVQKSA